MLRITILFERLAVAAISLIIVSGCAQSGGATSEAVLATATPFALQTASVITPTPGSNAALPSSTPVPPRIDPAVAASLPSVTLDVILHYDDRWMQVAQRVEIQNLSPDNWNEVVFSVPVNMDDGAFYLDNVTVTIGGIETSVYPYFPSGNNILTVVLPQIIYPGDTLLVDFSFNVVIQPVAKTAEPPVGLTGWTNEVIQAGEWYPALVPYLEGEGWLTWWYHPVGDPFVYAQANYNLTITTDSAITVASGGFVEVEDGAEGNSIWHFAMQGGRGIAFFASNMYETAVDEANGIPVTSYYFPDHAEAGQTALQVAVESLELYEQLYGQYPYTDLAVVENGFAGGMEYSGLISLSDFVYHTYPGQAPSVLHALTSHEVAHQWWYGSVGNDQVHEPWLDESLAFYSELLYFEEYYPDLIDWWWEVQVWQYGVTTDVDLSIYDFGHTSNYVVAVYGSSAQFLHDLRSLMGENDFFAFLSDYYASNQWSFVTADDFFAAVRSHTDEDLTSLLTTYFVNPDH
nr:M1 family metallopeptidase [Anaerolineae bacterium]